MLQDVAAERAILAGIAKYGYESFVDVTDLIKTDSFTLDFNQILYKCFEYIFEHDSKSKIDIPSILSAAKSLGLFDIISDPDQKSHLRAILNFAINKESIRKLAAKIKKLQIARQLIDETDTIKKELVCVSGDESLNTILNIPEKRILDFSLALGMNENEPIKMGNNIDRYIQNIMDNPNKSIGLSTGFKKYDKSIGGGIRRKTVNIIGARMKTGKSILALNISYNVSITNIPVLYMDTEMSEEDHYGRLLATLSNIKIDEIETGSFVKQDIKKNRLLAVKEDVKKLPFYYKNVSGYSFEEILSVARRWIFKTVGFDKDGNTKPCLIIHDYLKLMSSDDLGNNMAEFQLLGFHTTALHNFAVKYNVPVISFVQLNRDGISKEDTSTVMGSDRILQLGTSFAILRNKTPEEIAEIGPQYGNQKLVPLIARHGGGLVDGDYINIIFRKEFGQMTEGKTLHEILLEKQSDGSVSI